MCILYNAYYQYWACGAVVFLDIH